jgi:hypothetical protein
MRGLFIRSSRQQVDGVRGGCRCAPTTLGHAGLGHELRESIRVCELSLQESQRVPRPGGNLPSLGCGNTCAPTPRHGRPCVVDPEYEPGWRWSRHVNPLAGTPTCQVEHLGLVLSGRAAVKMDDGEEIVLVRATSSTSLPATIAGSWATSPTSRCTCREPPTTRRAIASRGGRPAGEAAPPRAPVERQRRRSGAAHFRADSPHAPRWRRRLRPDCDASHTVRGRRTRQGRRP